MAPKRITLTWEDVQTVAAKIEEVAPPVTRDKIARAFGIATTTLSKSAQRDGWIDELTDLTTPSKVRSVDEALKAVAELVSS